MSDIPGIRDLEVVANLAAPGTLLMVPASYVALMCAALLTETPATAVCGPGRGDPGGCLTGTSPNCAEPTFAGRARQLFGESP